MLKARVLYGLISCIIIFQMGCLNSYVKHDPDPVPVPSKITVVKVTPVGCEDDPLDFYNAMPVLSDVEVMQSETQDLQTQKIHQDCSKLRKAIKLSIPGSDIQNDEKALVLLNQLKLNSTLVGRDLKFTLLLLQHVSQRQQLRKLLAAQEKRRIKVDEKNRILKSQLEILQSQLDQLKKIEIEIDKKERSVISPIGE